MKIYYSTKFKKEYKRLSPSIKKQAEQKEKLFRKNIFHPLLKTHKLTNKLKNFWAFSINYQTRIIFEIIDQNTIWFHSVGSHQIYR